MTQDLSVDLDPSVCYRHPGRQSWELCQRCGRTICAECQIPAASGVRCPSCVQESGASVQWRPAGPPPPPKRPARASRVRSWVTAESAGPTTSRAILIAAGVVWVVGFVTNNLPFNVLAALPGVEWQLWRFVTNPFAYPAGLSLAGILFPVLSGVFFFLSAPQLERMLGRPRFLAVFVVTTIATAAAQLLFGQFAYGLFGPLFGLFGALLYLSWGDRQARMQILLMTAVNVLLIVALTAGRSLPGMVLGMAAGAATLWLLQNSEYRKGPSARALLIGGCAALVALAVLRGVLL